MSGKALLLGVGRGGRLRLVATALGVAIGVASVVATLLATRAAIDSLAAGAEEVAGEARLELRQRGGGVASGGGKGQREVGCTKHSHRANRTLNHLEVRPRQRCAIRQSAIVALV